MGGNQGRIPPPEKLGRQGTGYLFLDESGWAWAVTDRGRATQFNKEEDNGLLRFTVASGKYRDYYLSANCTYGVGVYDARYNSCDWVLKDGHMKCCRNGHSSANGTFASCQEGELHCQHASPSDQCQIMMLESHTIIFEISCSMEATRVKLEKTRNDIEKVRNDPQKTHRRAGDDELRITSMNVRGDKDNVSKRMPPLMQEIKSTNADVYHLQESERHAEFQRALTDSGSETDRWIGHGLQTIVDESALKKRGFCLTGHTHEHFVVGMIHIRGFLVEKLVRADAKILIINTHLHYHPGQPQTFLQQTKQILAFLNDANGGNGLEWNAVILTGDFNGEPGEPFYEELVSAGFKSAMTEQYQCEVPTYKMGDAMMGDSVHEDVGEPFKHTLDYVWYKGQLELKSVGQIGTVPIDPQEFLFPSDHAGLVATFRVASQSPGPVQNILFKILLLVAVVICLCSAWQVRPTAEL